MGVGVAMRMMLELGSSRMAVECAPGSKIMDVLREEGLSPVVSIVFLGERPIPVDSEAEEGMVLRVVSVVSGG